MLAVISGQLKMTKKQLKIILPLITICVSGCFGQLSDSSSDRITGKYVVIWVNLPENQSISEQWSSSGSSQVVPEYVFAVGHNDDFIVAKQHPVSGDYEIDTKTTNYFIVDMKRNVLTKGSNVFGPLKINQFDSLRKILQIEKIEFDQNYPEKP